MALLVVSPDLPFARGQPHGAAPRTVRLSSFRSPGFARPDGVELVSGPLRGLLAPAPWVLDARQRVLRAQLVREIGEAPDLDAALAAVTSASARDAATRVA